MWQGTSGASLRSTVDSTVQLSVVGMMEIDAQQTNQVASFYLI